MKKIDDVYSVNYKLDVGESKLELINGYTDIFMGRTYCTLTFRLVDIYSSNILGSGETEFSFDADIRIDKESANLVKIENLYQVDKSHHVYSKEELKQLENVLLSHLKLTLYKNE